MDGLLLTDNERRLMMETVTIELFADDLSEAGIQKFKDQDVWNANWDIMPLVVMEFEVEEPIQSRWSSVRLKKPRNNLCPFCHDPVLANMFRDKQSIDEWTISGLCAKCQDEVFGVGE